ncbi:alpha/beta hydrolase [Plantibacter flavus]|uniref:alpha/beta hydrolase n=1 Tax=Plantibacter flavus TaxID=150123 RepID=UPI003F17BE77
MTSSRPRTRFSRFLRVVRNTMLWIIGLIVSIALIITVWLQLTPWPGSMVIRAAFDERAKVVQSDLVRYVPDGVDARHDIPYRSGDEDALLDVYTPDGVRGSGAALPTIVWVHGGAWISGGKDLISNYMRVLAGEGYTVVAVDYTIAPEGQYPLPIEQVADSLGYLAANARAFNVDPKKLILAGDSAGAQIAAQVANIVTSSEYASAMKIESPIAADQLAGVILACGAYDLSLVNAEGSFGWFLDTVLWAYFGARDYKTRPEVASASVVDYLTANYPPTYITVGNWDPLYPQSTEFKAKLQGLGVEVQSMIFNPAYRPGLEHEYQFLLNDQGRFNLGRMDAFVDGMTDTSLPYGQQGPPIP